MTKAQMMPVMIETFLWVMLKMNFWQPCIHYHTNVSESSCHWVANKN